MNKHCESCGGIIGIDCFNPAECAYITMLQEAKLKQDNETLAYREGVIAGMTRFAWWKDGVQWVGNCGTSLKEAIEDFEKEKGD